MQGTFLKHFTLISIITGSLAVSACSGSSGGSPSLPPPPPPETPTLNMAVAMKQLQFSWDSVPGATYYRINENADGVSGFSPVSGNLGAAVITYNHEISVHLQDWPNARYLVEACNASGCTASNELSAVNSSVNAIGYFKASNSDANDFFGYSVAISGDGKTMAVGARTEDSNATVIDGDETNQGTTDSGAVYVYRQAADGAWIKDVYIKGSKLTASDWFGSDVSLSRDGNTLAVSAPQDELSTTNSGVVYIFTRDGTGTCSESAILEATTGDATDRFGQSISLNATGDKLLVGVPYEDSDLTGVLKNLTGISINNAKSGSGAAYLFSRNGDESWSVSAYFKAAVTDINDQFGWAVDISGDSTTLVISAYGEDSKAANLGGNANDNSAAQSGAAYVFRYESGTWLQKSFLKATNAEGGRPGIFPVGDNFGYDVSISGNGEVVSVSAPWEQSNTTFDVTDQTNNALEQAGAVYIFEQTPLNTWEQTQYIKAPDTTPNINPAFTIQYGDLFGRGISISKDGNLLAIGAVKEDSNALGINGDTTNNSLAQSGAVYTYKRDGSNNWTFGSYIKSSNPDGNLPNFGPLKGDGFGYAVALSDDGKKLAVSATGEAGGSDTINGDLTDNSAGGAGAVYLY